MANQLKKVLVINYVFPPVAGSGVIRTQKFVKNLPRNGWLPVVLTLNEKYGDKLDYTLLNEIPSGTRIYRTKMFDVNIIYSLFGRRTNNEIEKTSPILFSKNTLFNESRIHKFLKEIFHILFITPDKYAGWLIPGIFKGFYVMLREKIKIIYSSSPSPTAHIIALFLKKVTKNIWVADFRDPWYKHTESSKLRLKMENLLELKVILNADKIISNTQYLKDIFIQKYGNKIADKIHIIPNGYDSDDFVNLESTYKKQSDILTISHVGEFYDELRTPDDFLNCISELIREGKLSPNNIQINFVGGGEYSYSEKFTNLLQRLELTKTVNLINHVPHRKSIEYMLQSDVLLLLQPSPKFKLQIPAKAFEYIRAGRYIFAITPRNGATANLINEVGNGIVVEPNSSLLIKEALSKIYDKFLNSQLFVLRNVAVEANYDRAKLTTHLADIFNELTLFKN